MTCVGCFYWVRKSLRRSYGRVSQVYYECMRDGPCIRLSEAEEASIKMRFMEVQAP